MTKFNTKIMKIKKNSSGNVDKVINLICELLKFDKTNGSSYLVETNMVKLLQQQ